MHRHWLQTSYFDSTHNHQNGLCEEEEAAPTPAVEDTVAEAGKNVKIHCFLACFCCIVRSLWIHQTNEIANVRSVLNRNIIIGLSDIQTAGQHI